MSTYTLEGAVILARRGAWRLVVVGVRGNFFRNFRHSKAYYKRKYGLLQKGGGAVYAHGASRTMTKQLARTGGSNGRNLCESSGL